MIPKSKVRRGIRVRISSGACTKTDRTFTVVGEMQEMKGKIFKIENPRIGSGVRIEGYTWHIDDLHLITNKNKKKIAPEMFDVNNLDT